MIDSLTLQIMGTIVIGLLIALSITLGYVWRKCTYCPCERASMMDKSLTTKWIS